MGLRKIALVSLAALLLIGIPLGYYWMSKSADPPVPLLAKATRRDLRAVVSTNGIIEPVDREDVVAPIDGFVSRLAKKEGDAVKPGQTLLQLESEQLRTALAEAKAALLRAQGEAQPVLSGPPREELDAVDASIAETDLQLEQARSDLRTEEALLAKAATPREAVENLRKQVKLLEVRAAALKRRRESLLARHSADEKQWETGRIKELTAQVALLEDQLRKGTVEVQRAGALYSVAVRAGSYVNKGQLLAQVYEPGSVQLRAYVDEPDLGRIQAGQQVLIEWDGLPDGRWTAVVRRPAEQVVPLGTRSVGQVICAVEDHPKELIPNINVHVRIVTAARASALVVPRVAVFNQDGKAAVSRWDSTKTVVVPVQLGLVTADEAEIVQGINEGDSVAVNPAGNP
jgi:HlyD family secretion protein